VSASEIRIASLAEGVNPLAFEVGGSDLRLSADDELTLDRPLTVSLEIVRVEETLDIRGRIQGTGLVACSRCGMDAPLEIDLPFRLIGQERPETAPEDVESEDLVYHDGDSLELGETLREIVLVSVPMAPLCKEACKGLCPGCGVDLNLESCTCGERPADPRWNKLSELLDRDGER